MINKKFKIIIFGIAIFSASFLGHVLAQEKEERLELPIDVPYDDIEFYDYPYLIPPPKLFNPGNLGMYEEQKDQEKDNEPKLFYVARPSAPNIYWKERTYDVYTGQGWLIQNVDTRDKEKNIKSVGTPLRFEIYKFLKKGIYSLDLLTPFTDQSSINKNSFEIFPDQKFDLLPNVYDDTVFNINVESDTNIKYQADYYPPDFDIRKAGDLKDVPEEMLEAYATLPEEFPKKLKDIAQGLKEKSGGVLSEQILNTYSFVQDNVEYDLKWGAGQTIPKDYDMALWTYENKKGICSHFATLFITLARAQGIPARLAVGFAGGKVEKDSVYIYSSYAHGWAEVYLPNYGWVPIDPTKGSRGGEERQGQEEEQKTPPEWSNGGNVQPDLKFTLDEQLQKEKDKAKQEGFEGEGGQGGEGGEGGGSGSGSGSGSGQGGEGSESGKPEGNPNFTGDPSQLSQLDKWFESEDSAKLEEKYENWLKEQQKLAENTSEKSDNSDNSDKEEEFKDSEVDKDEKDEEKTADEDKGIVSELKQAISSIGKNSSENGLTVIVLTSIFILVYFIYKNYIKVIGIESKIEERIKAVNRFVDIDEVIKKTEALYGKKEYNTAIVYGYNELENYISYVFDIINEPGLTAREFENAVAKIRLFRPLSIIIENFEKAKYSFADSEQDCSVFLTALREVAASSKIKK